MTDAEIAALSELNARRTPGEWHLEPDIPAVVYSLQSDTDHLMSFVTDRDDTEQMYADSRWIAGCTKYVPALLEEVKRLRGTVEFFRDSGWLPKELQEIARKALGE